MSAKYTIGLDYGTNSVRTLIVNIANGREVATAVWNYAHGDAGRHPLRATRTSPGSIPPITSRARRSRSRKRSPPAKKTVRGFSPDQVIGIGVDTTGSTPLPVDAQRPAARLRQTVRQEPRGDGLAVEGPHRRRPRPRRSRRWRARFARNISPNAAAPIPANGSSARSCIACAPRPEVFDAAYTRGWNAPIGCPPCSPAPKRPDKLTVGICAAGHKAMYNDDWGGYPDAEFLSQARSETGRTARTAAPAGAHHRPKPSAG